MRTKKSSLLLTGISVFVFATGYALSRSSSASERPHGLLLTVRSDKTTYLPGDKVSLVFTIVNKSNSPTAIYKGSTVWDGYLKVFIAKENGGFREYFGPAWGVKDAH